MFDATHLSLRVANIEQRMAKQSAADGRSRTCRRPDTKPQQALTLAEVSVGEDEGRLLNHRIHSLTCLPRLTLCLPLAYSFRDEGKNKAVQADSLSFGLGRKLRVERFRESLYKFSGHS
jgi:hypothetical protein